MGAGIFAPAPGSLMMMRNVACLAILATVIAAAPAKAESEAVPLTVQTDMSMLIMLPNEPNTVVIGNPSVADISLNGKQMFVHGHAFGETNIMVLDGSGATMANYYVNVMHNTNNQLTVFASNSTATAGVDRRTYTCAPNCEGNPMPGDNTEFFKQITGASQTRYGNATGIKTADVKPQSNQPQ
jgi:hypothetical protein